MDIRDSWDIGYEHIHRILKVIVRPLANRVVIVQNYWMFLVTQWVHLLNEKKISQKQGDTFHWRHKSFVQYDPWHRA